MEIAHIYPVLNTDRIYGQSISMALTHLVQKYPAYAEAFSKYSGYKILDNSIIELGSSLTLADVMHAAAKIDADEVILPDVLGNMTKTLDNAKEAISAIKYYAEAGKCKMPKLMAVCQGYDESSVYKCFEALSKMDEIDVIGIPKHITSMKPEGRPGFEQMWLDSNKTIHLLGLAHSFAELDMYKHPEKIRSCDTCLFSYLAKNGLHISNIRPSGAKFDLEKEFITSKEYENVD